MSQEKLTVENTFNESVKQRFISKLKKPNEKGCIEWGAGIDAAGYGVFMITTAPKEYVLIKAHRWALGFVKKRILSSDEFACHHCDNPACVNPMHLFVGSNQDNVDDMVGKNRQQSKLTPTIVKEIREHLNKGTYNASELSRMYNVAHSCIRAIRDRKSWKHLK